MEYDRCDGIVMGVME